MDLLRSRELAAGITLLGLAAFFLWFGRDLPLGSSTFMEAGFFPRMIAIALGGLGLVIAAQGIRSCSTQLSSLAWKPLAILTVSVVIFGAIVPRAGLVATCLVVVLVASLASGVTGVIDKLVVAVVLTLVMVGLFHFGLKLPIPLWPSW